MSDSLKIVLTTVPDEGKGAEIASVLLSERLCACVNIAPLARSIYRWEGKICDEKEALLLLKTSGGALADLKNRLSELHPYSVPEWVVLDPESVSEAYRTWVLAETAR